MSSTNTIPATLGDSGTDLSRVQVSLIGGGNGQLVNVTSRSVTGFSVFGVDVNGSARSLSFDWMIVRF